MTKLILGWIIFLLYSIVIFLIGFSVGNTKAQYKNMSEELSAAEKLFTAQGDKPEQIKASLEIMRLGRLKEIGGTKRQILSIWLPSSLVIINIILTILFKTKGNP